MAEEEKLKKETKSMLRAVLISAPRGVIARKLQAEYESITGKSIPYRKLGFCTLEDYLRSIPDVISASEGSTGELTFFGVADASTNHIAKLVSKQRKPKLSRAHVPPPRAFTPKQNKFFGHRSPMRPAGPSSARFNDRGPRRTPLMESTRMAPHSTESQDMLLSADGIGNCRDDLSKAHLVPISGLSSQVTISKNRMLKVQGYVSGDPQLRNYKGHRRYGTVLVRDSLPKGFTIMCLFSTPVWDPNKNTDFLKYMSDGDSVVIYAYPDVINTPKYNNGKSVALQVVAVQVNTKSCSPMMSRPQDLRAILPPKRSFQDDRNDLRHTLSRPTVEDDPNDLRHVIRKNTPGGDLRMVINDQKEQQQFGGREVMLSDVPGPTTSTAPQLLSSPLRGAEAQLEKEVYEIVQNSRAGVWWKRLEVLYKNKFNSELPSGTQELVRRMRSVTVEEHACDLIVYPATPPPTTPLLPNLHPPTASSLTSTHSDGFMDTLPAQTPLKVGETVLFVITNVRSPSCFYGYKMADNERVNELIKEVHSLYQDTPSSVPQGGVVPGRTYAAQFSEDQVWYRAKVESVDEDKGIFNVFYLDFGNEEAVPRERLRPLSAKLSSLPPVTVQLALSPADVTPDQGTGWNAEASSKFSDLILDKEVHAVITSCIRDTSGYRYEVQAMDLFPGLVEAGIARLPKPQLPVEVPLSPPTQTVDTVRDGKQSPPPLPSIVDLPDKLFECYLSHVLSPASFYIQRIGTQYHKELESLEQGMTMHYARNMPDPVQEPKEDSLVALRSVEEDGSTYWYRAKVRANLPQEGKVELKLVDYGNTDVVEAKDVMLLPSKFYQLPFQAIHCCLRGLSDFLESPKIYETFMEYQLQDKALTAKVVTSPGTRITLELIDQENIEKGSINVQLMNLGTPISQLSPVLPSVGERVSVNVTDISAEGVVSVQLHGPSLPHLDDLMKLINAQYSQKSTATNFVQDVAEGMLCCAKYDSEWYRVKVLKVEEKSVHVEYTDSGKTATLERRDLRKQLEDRLFGLPPQAVKCKLADLPPPNGEWRETAVSVFWDAVGDCLNEIEVVSSSSGELPLIRMWCKAEDGEEQDVSALLCAQPEAFGPPVQQESSSDQADRTDPYEDFTFETDTTGEEDEAEGSGGRSESDQAPDSKGESPKSDKGAVESTIAQPAQSTSGDLSEAAVSDGANKIGLFNVAEVKSFVGHLAPPEMVKETFVPAYVSYVSSPTDFWLATCTLDKEYKRFQAALEAYCNHAPRVDAASLTEDTVFSVKKNSAGEWARARRVDQTQAFLIDSGGLLVLSGHVCVLLPPVLSQVPPLAVRCSLCGLKPDSAGHWSQMAVAKFSEMVERHNLCVLAVGIQKEGERRRHLVELVDTATPDGSDFIISYQLVEMGLAVSTLPKSLSYW